MFVRASKNYTWFIDMNLPIYGHIRALMLVSIASDTLECYQCPMCDLCSYEKPWSQIIMGYHLLIWITQTSFPVYQSNGQMQVKKITEEQRFHFSMLMQNMILKHLLGILGKLKWKNCELFIYLVTLWRYQNHSGNASTATKFILRLVSELLLKLCKTEKLILI